LFGEEALALLRGELALSLSERGVEVVALRQSQLAAE
jgi:hypothetical protein